MLAAAGVQADAVLRIPSQGDLPQDGYQQGDIHVMIAVCLP